MAEAKIALTLTPQEFDLLRETLETQRSVKMALIRSIGVANGERAQARQQAYSIGELLKKLR